MGPDIHLNDSFSPGIPVGIRKIRSERLTGRKLFILTREDFSGGGVLRLPEIRKQYERAPDPKEIVILEGSAHAQFIFETDQGERLMREILRFLSEP